MPDDPGNMAVLGTAAAFALALLVVLVIAVLRAGASWVTAAAPGALLLSVIAAAVQPDRSVWDGAFNIAGYALVFVVYPDGRVRPRWLLVPLLACLVWAGAFVAFGDQPWAQSLTLTELLFAPVLVHRYRRRLSTAEREQVRWAVLGAIITFTGMIGIVAVAFASGRTTIQQIGPVAESLAALFTLTLPACLVIGLTRPRLAPIDMVIFHTIRILACTVPIAVGAGLIARNLPGIGGAWTAAIFAAGSVAPLWLLGGWLGNLFVFRHRLTPRRAISMLDQALSCAHPAEDAPQIVADAVRLALDTTAVRVTGTGIRRCTAGAGELAMASESPVAYAGEIIATIAAAPRPAESTLTAADLTILRDLAARAAPSLHAARTVTALLDARAALVLAHEEERKRLRRDLHDDLAPTLVGLRLTATGLTRVLAPLPDPVVAGAAAALLADVDAAIAQTRALAYGLRPPMLDDRGLVDAIRDRARSDTDLRIRLDAPDEPLELPAAVETAALRVAQEAVTNVRTHAGATHCTVRIRREPQALLVSVDDDGVGFDTAALAESEGIGLGSIRDRVHELGGQVRFDRSSLGGARVVASIPLTDHGGTNAGKGTP